MIHLLHDTPDGYSFIEKRIGLPVVRHDSPQHKSKMRTWLAGSYEVMRNSKPGDMIVCVLDIQAVMCYIVGLLTFHRRKIFAINLLLKHKPTLKNRITSLLYKLALNSNNFRATVTSPYYGEWLNTVHGMSHHYDILQDVYYSDYDTDGETRRGDYVFCGGVNGRDWQFMFEVAALMPDTSFKIVMPGTLKEKYSDIITENVEVICDIPKEKFLELMDNSALVCCPLDTEAPAGLIVMFQATGHNKVIIATDTASSRVYVDNSRGFLLEKDADRWVAAIREIMAMDDTGYKTVHDNMKSFVKDYCSETRYVSTLERHLRDWSVQTEK